MFAEALIPLVVACALNPFSVRLSSSTARWDSGPKADTRTADPVNTAGTYFRIGTGFVDAVPHQVVRSASDHLYLFAINRPYSTMVKAYWTITPGLPESDAELGTSQFDLAANPISISPAYDGAVTIHVVTNLQNGSLVDVPFDLATNSFRPPRDLAGDAAAVAGDYEGSSGVSAMFDRAGHLHVAYWAAGDHISHLSYTYDAETDVLTSASASYKVDTSGLARHPSLAVSPLDNSVTIAWVSLASMVHRILARDRSASGNWSTVHDVSNPSTAVWTSLSAGIDIDQGPSMLITSDGTRHLTYIEAVDRTNDYGRVHYVTSSGRSWVDQPLAAYSHDPALAVTAAGEMYIIGHGHPNDASAACRSLDDVCVRKQHADGTWGPSTLFAPHATGSSFDSSPSVKWSVAGWNRPDVIEFVFFQTPYASPTLFYGRIQ